MSDTNLKKINDDIKNFIILRTPQSIALESQFSKIKKNKWDDSMVIIAELNVQLGQLFSIFETTEDLEPERKFQDIGDELSDILLSLLYLSSLEKMSGFDIIIYKSLENTDLRGLSVVLGKLSEAILEKKGYRFQRNHGNFPDLQSYIISLISLMYLIIFAYANENNIDLNYEFQKMIDSAQNFVEQKKSGFSLKKTFMGNLWKSSTTMTNMNA